MQKPLVIIAFGGVSAEHEVSVVTGLQVVEKIDRNAHTPYVVYIKKDGQVMGYGDLKNRKGFLATKPVALSWGRDEQGGFIQESGVFGKKFHPHAAYFAFHGGTGESGPMQGMCEALDIPFTSSGVEGSAIVMNKALGKEVLNFYGLPVVDGENLRSTDILKDVSGVAAEILTECPLPLIIKPVHLGSSIGISIAKTQTELERFLLTAAHMDSEVVVEKLLTNMKEYNCSVRAIGGKIEASEVESPVAHDAILSFADKYERGGGKKSGASSGMASLQRELPAKISEELKKRIQETAIHAFTACRCKGMARIDFMVTGEDLFITEINPIPGSMAFYLWEASGISFTQQITDMIEQAVLDAKQQTGKQFGHESKIIETFINQTL